MKIIYLVLPVVGFVPFILSGDPEQKEDDHIIEVNHLHITAIFIFVGGAAGFSCSGFAYCFNHNNETPRKRRLTCKIMGLVMCWYISVASYVVAFMAGNKLFKQIVVFVVTTIFSAACMTALSLIVATMRPDSTRTKRLLYQYDARLRDVEQGGKSRTSDRDRVPLLSSPCRKRKRSISTSLGNIHSSRASQLGVDIPPPIRDEHLPSLTYVNETRTAAASSSGRAEYSSRHSDSPSRLSESLSRHAESSSRRVASSSTRAESSSRLTESLPRLADSSSRREESSSTRADSSSRLTESLSRHAESSLRRVASSSTRAEPSSRFTESLWRHAESSSRRVASTRAESSPRGPESSTRLTKSLSRRVESSSRRAETSSKLTGSLSRRAESSSRRAETSSRDPPISHQTTRL